MRPIRTEQYPKKHGVGFVNSNRQSNLLRSCILRRLRLPSHIKFENSREMAMQFDHMYIECLDTKSSLGKEVEAKHLKDLVLLHLDLIQQQAEDLAAKDKIIKDLKDENENLRSRLERSERSSSASYPKPATDNCHAISSSPNLTYPIKDECKEEQSSISNNNNNVVTSPGRCGLGSPASPCTAEATTTVQSPLLQALRQDASPAAPEDSNTTTTSSPALTPCSRVLRNASSPVLKSCGANAKDENVHTSCSGGKSFITDLISPLRHSPRLDGSNIVNYSPSSDTGRRDADSPSSVCSRGFSIKSDTPQIPTANTLKGSESPVFASKLSLSYKRQQSMSTKISITKDRKTKSDPNFSENESDAENKAELSHQLPSNNLTTRQHISSLPYSSPSAKRKSEPLDEEPDNKKCKRVTADTIIAKDYLSAFETSLDYDSDGPTNHSLRSRDKTTNSTTSSLAEDSPSSKTEQEEETSVGRSSRLRSLSGSCSSSDEASKTEDGGVSAQEYERVFLKTASDAAARLREQNVRVPGCTLRPVRSTEGLLSTEHPYYLPTEPPADLTEPSDSLACGDSSTALNKQVEIPRWRVCVLSSLYVMEGTENLEDEIFTKRHNKLEQDEKRRKRWDLQRLREQRQYEKLKERYEVRNSASSSAQAASSDGDVPVCSGLHCPHTALSGAGGAVTPTGTSCTAGGTTGGGTVAAGVCGAVAGGAGGAGEEIVSLWPDPENALFLEVVDKVPVCAFGQPCAVTPSSEFSLPWLSSSAQDGVAARRKKR